MPWEPGDFGPYAEDPSPDPTGRVLEAVRAERGRQEKLHPHPPGSDSSPDEAVAVAARRNDAQLLAFHREQDEGERLRGEVNWRRTMLEEVYEALSEVGVDEARLRVELVQVAAVAVRWIEALDRRKEGAS